MDAIKGRFKDVMHAIASRNKPDTTMQSNSAVDLPRSVIGRPGFLPPVDQSSSLPLVSGESAILTLTASYSCPVNGNVEGSIMITNFRLWFQPYRKLLSELRLFPIPMSTIAKAEFSSKKERLHIECKDFRNAQFFFDTTNNEAQLEKFNEHLTQFCFPEKARNLFAFDHNSKLLKGSPVGWGLYDLEKEYVRIFSQSSAENSTTTDTNTTSLLASQGWRLSNINHDFSLCASYPSLVCVPNEMSEEDLKKLGEFRSKGRIPSLTWRHPQQKSTITRCSQPKVGPFSKQRSDEDEKMLRLIHKSNPKSTFLYVMDARPRVNAVANQAKKGGSENLDNYENIVLEFLGIENIHVMRESLKKLRALCWTLEADPHFFANLETCGWFTHLSFLLDSSRRIAHLIDGGSSVLVHCSDGWDRTSQLVALAELMLDPYYRTIRGFAVLIEKDWIDFGHKFEQRHGHGSKKYDDQQRAPIFWQFLDCVWQILRQFPTAFEFHEGLLLYILDAVHSCQYGTFLFNTNLMRSENRVKELTPSLWSYVMSNFDQFHNPHYIPHGKLLVVQPNPRELRLWTSSYMRYLPIPSTLVGGGSTPHSDGLANNILNNNTHNNHLLGCECHIQCDLLKARLWVYEQPFIEKRKENLAKQLIQDNAALIKMVYGATSASETSEGVDLDKIIEQLRKLQLDSARQENYAQAQFYKEQGELAKIYRDDVLQKRKEEVTKQIQHLEELKTIAAQQDQYAEAAKYRDKIKELQESLNTPLRMASKSTSLAAMVNNNSNNNNNVNNNHSNPPSKSPPPTPPHTSNSRHPSVSVNLNKVPTNPSSTTTTNSTSPTPTSTPPSSLPPSTVGLKRTGSAGNVPSYLNAPPQKPLPEIPPTNSNSGSFIGSHSHSQTQTQTQAQTQTQTSQSNSTWNQTPSKKNEKSPPTTNGAANNLLISQQRVHNNNEKQ